MSKHESIRQLEDAIGRPLLESDRGSVPNLNDMPQYVVAEARLLGRGGGRNLLVHKLLMYYAGADNFSHVKVFMDDVICGGFPASLWCKGESFLVPSTSLNDQLCSTPEQLLAPIGGFQGLRLVPDLPHWRVGSPNVGAPGARGAGRNYRTRGLKGTTDMANYDIEAVADAEIAVRRWIATRIARCAPEGQPPTVESLRTHLPSVPESHTWTEDARIAMRALGREAAELEPDAEAVPGFKGPDAWYR